MPEKEKEGLEAGELLDQLDVEVPTAAVSIYHSAYDMIIVEKRSMELTHDEELVRREDHEEALEEAVQQAREQERRRILNKIEELKTDLEEENLEGRLIWGVANQNQRKTAINTVKE